MMWLGRGLALLALGAYAGSGCRGDGGACGYCDQADDGCVARCEQMCAACSSVDPDRVEDVRCVDERLHVQTDDGIHVCFSQP
jgi:hypothetical protein